MAHKLRFTFLVFLLVSGCPVLWHGPAGRVNGQSIENIGKPDILGFSKQDYHAYHQNWSICQHGKTRFMYIANSKGLLEYDGSQWQVYELPNKQKVRSVASGMSGEIYTGGLGEFGYWKPDARGKLAYHSLKHRIDYPYFASEEIWNILSTSQGILFQSFAVIYLYSRHKLQKLSPPGNILFAHQVNGRVFLEVIDKGLYELKGTSFQLLENSEFLGKASVNTILPAANPGEILVGTSKGIYVYDGHTFREFNAATNAFLLQNQLNRGIQLSANRYAFGTILNGIILTDASGRIVQHLNQKNGLQNNTILSLYKDADGNLWAGMDKGINLVLVSSPVRYYHDYDGRLGTVYDVALHQGRLYLGTNHGLFFTETNAPEANFRLVPKTQGQVWDLAVIDGQLLCGHNTGTFLIEDTQARLISAITGGWVIKKLRKHPDLLIQGTYTQLCIYKKGPDQRWQLSHALDGFSAPVHQLEEDSLGDIWVNKASKGLSRIRLSSNAQKIDSIWTYANADLNSAHVNLAFYKQQVLVTTNHRLLHYQAATNTFAPATELQKQLGNVRAQKFFPIADQQAFVLKNGGELGFIEADKSLKDIPVKRFQWFDEYENLVAVDSANVVVCTENGFGLLPLRAVTQLWSAAVHKPIIRGVSLVDYPALNQAFARDTIPGEHSFAYNQNSLILSFSTPYYSNPVKYSYWLENSSQHWSPYQDIQQKEFNNLSPGKYIFHLRSNLSPKETTFTFEIHSPWYWNRWSISFYLVLLVIMGGLSYGMHLRRVKAQQEKVSRKLERKLRKHEEESQREIMRLRNEQLEKDVVRKSEELANSTMTLIKKNELLHQIRQEVLALKSDTNTRLNPHTYQQILHLIESNISSEHDWKVFENNFNRVHEEFLQKLIGEYPNLTPNDLKLAAYLRMNLSTKEIAQLFNITYRSLELKRYRLRKKMNLDTSVNLGEFMMKYGITEENATS